MAAVRLLPALLLVGAIAAPSIAGAAAEAVVRGHALRQKQMIRTERLGIARPAGIAYAGDADLFIVLPARVPGAEPAAAVELMDRFHQATGSIRLPGPLANARAAAYDRHGERLLLLDVATRSLHAIPGGATGVFDHDRTVSLAAPRVGPLRPAGMTVDPASGEVFILDRLMRRILRFSPASADAGPEARAAVPEARRVELGALASAELSGLAFDPASGHLFTLDVERRTLHELAVDGTPVKSYDLSAIAFSDPQSLVFAPSGDQTDDPAMLSLFVADPGAPAGRRGHVIELAWTRGPYGLSAEPSLMGAASTAATLVRVTQTSSFSPPSSDPTGVTYDSATGRLVISDAEVEELSYWAGKNVWETTLAGSVQRSYSVTSFTIEPCDVAYDATNRQLYFVDDDADKVFVVSPGGDNVFGTSDDSRRSFTTRGFSSTDPEGVAFDRVNRRLFIADGVNEEIYVLRPGPNGIFDGVPPTGDDQLTQFDTGALGVTDPEAVAYKEDTGTLLLLSSTGSATLKEVTTTGGLLSQTDLSFASLKRRAGMTYAPTSNNPGGRSLYVADAGSWHSNDGRLVEISLGGSVGNTAPVVSAGPDQTITLPSSASLDGTVTDDGLPSPPALTTTWSTVSGPGTVTFASANSVDTQATFSIAGTYVLRLTASDGALSANDEVQVTVQPTGSGGNAAPVVSAGPNLTITFPGQAALDGTVTDDGLPAPPVLTTAWSVVSGPGTVTFLNANAVDTQASVSVVGTYVLRLTASDGSLTGSAQTQITVQGSASATDFRVAAGGDDAEESATGSVYTNSSDLELVFDGTHQTVGLRFTNVSLPRGAQITTAYVQFQADESQIDVMNLLVQGQAADNAATFTTAKFNVSSRPRTTASVAWAPPAWNTVGEAAANQRTPELKSVIQEIVDRPGWASGNALGIIITGTGHRTAEAYEGLPAGAALLHVEIAAAVSNVAPVVNAGPDQTITLPAQASLDGTVTDDGLPSPPALSYSWSVVSGPGAVAFGNASAVDTQAGFSTAGTYVLRLAASDGQSISADLVQIIVRPPPVNTAPVVNAGPDQTISITSSVVLDGTVTDDGLPTPPALTYAWSKVSGPGTVTFVNANAVDTQASFSLTGTYVLQLSSSDGLLSGSDQIQVIVQPANTAPTVNAGPDLQIVLPAQAVLDGTVTDDGLPSPPALTYSWTKVSGPGTVTFVNANAVDTQAAFSVAGTYVLQLSASDGALSRTDQAQVVALPAGTVIRRISVGSDDAEESAGGKVSRAGNDLELVYSNSIQKVGLRFRSLAIPQGATIVNAAIQFRADETQSEATSLLIQGQAAGNPATFVNTNLNVSSRPRTTASVAWAPAPWGLVGEAGANQRTTDISSIIQEIVNRPDWVSGNSIVIIITGTGHRTAESYEGMASGAPQLELLFQ